MKERRYRVETFIIPMGNDRYAEAVLTKTDDAKITEKLKSSQIAEIPSTKKFDSQVGGASNDAAAATVSSTEECMQNLKNTMLLEESTKKNGTKCSEVKTICLSDDLNASFGFCKEDIGFYGALNSACHLNIFDKLHTLMSIDEKAEDSDERSLDLCYHGCRNGCSATVQDPQRVSEAIFKENWLQKLDSVRQKEAALRSKETLLQNRERALFKRERDMRIMERLLKDKLKQVECNLKQNRNWEIAMVVPSTQEDHSGSRSPNSTEKWTDVDIPKLGSNIEDCTTEDAVAGQMRELAKCMGRVEQRDQREANACAPSSSDPNITKDKQHKKPQTLRNSKTFHLSTSKFSSASTDKSKKPCKIYYEDLDSTLSADIGDSSFVQTSRMFNPELYKKPYAFTRSLSERRTRRTDNKNFPTAELDNLAARREDALCPIGIEQDRVLKRVAQNITASQDKGTKFQHYGLIDNKVRGTRKEQVAPADEAKDEKKYSYLNLEVGGQFKFQRCGQATRDRPVSWNEGTNEWLQKKRQAYNLATKKIPTEDFDKENLGCAKAEKTEKVVKRRDIRNKIFTIFR